MSGGVDVAESAKTPIEGGQMQFLGRAMHGAPTSQETSELLHPENQHQ